MLEDLREASSELDGLVDAALSGVEAAIEQAEAFGRRVRVDTWRRVAQGEVDRPGAWLEVVRPNARRLRRAKAGDICTRALAWIASLEDELAVAVAALPQSAPEIARPRTTTEEAILRALEGAPGPMARSQVHGRLPSDTRPTLPAVGQALDRLATAGLVERRVERRQGAAQASTWLLAPSGRRALAAPVEAPGVGAVVALVAPGDARLPARRMAEFVRRYAATCDAALVVDLDADPLSDWLELGDTGPGLTELHARWLRAGAPDSAWLAATLRDVSVPVPGLPSLRWVGGAVPVSFVAALRPALAELGTTVFVRGSGETPLALSSHWVVAVDGRPGDLEKLDALRARGRVCPVLVDSGSGRPAGVDTLRAWFGGDGGWPEILGWASQDRPAARFVRLADVPPGESFIGREGQWLPSPATVGGLLGTYDLLAWEVARRCGVRPSGGVPRFRAWLRDTVDEVARTGARERAGQLATLDQPLSVQLFRSEVEGAFAGATGDGRRLLARAAASVLAKQVAAPAGLGRRLAPSEAA